MATVMKEYTIDHDASSQQVDELGMRKMQRRAWQKRDSNNILIKSPPASGKSRALMFLALYKLIKQGLMKTIVSVPERSIGSSFKSTNLTDSGFFADWEVPDKYNLCLDINEIEGTNSKVKAFLNFMADPDAQVLLCTHSSLRTAFKNLDIELFENCLLAIDEFHHISVSDDNRLGELVTQVLESEKTHVLGMTGSYFRGDTNAVLRPEHEALFDVVTFTYYEQLQGYRYLKKLNIGHHFYPPVKSNDVAAYIAGVRELYDPDRKTIIHIPHAASKESEDKIAEYEAITDIIGDFVKVDPDTGLSHYLDKETGRTFRVANLVEEGKRRDAVMRTLRDERLLDTVDVVIALNMAKEGFDWPAAEYAITVGSRGSLTEVIQIIGRVTRDHPGKYEATFVNLIKEPIADQVLVEDAVNDILKAISASLLMEQVINPRFQFSSKSSGDTKQGGLFEFKIEGFNPPKSDRVKEILSQDRDSLMSDIINGVHGKDAAKVLADNEAGAEFLNNALIPRIIERKYGEGSLSDDEVDELRQQLVLEMNIPSIKEEAEKQKQRQKDKSKETDDSDGDKKEPRQRSIIDAAKKLNVQDLSLDMVERVNPFIDAYEVMAKAITPELLLLVRNHIKTHRGGMSLEDAAALYPAIKKFMNETGRKPSFDTESDREYQLAEAVQTLAAEKARRKQQGK